MPAAWSEADDEALRRAVKMWKKDWANIASAVGRSSDDVQLRWKTVLHPRLSRGPWTPEVRHGRRRGLSARAAHMLCRGLTSAQPSPFLLSQEDAEVIRLVGVYGAQKWSVIADHLPGRVGKQCRER
jgi:transcriptional activator Myb